VNSVTQLTDQLIVSYARVGADTTTPAAAYGSNAFVFHTV